MPRVVLYEDTGGGLFLHREGDDFVVSGVELAVPYGAEFLRDAEALDGGAPPGEGNERIPLDEFEERADGATVRAIAAWEDGQVNILHTPGPYARTYLEAYHRASSPVMPGYQK